MTGVRGILLPEEKTQRAGLRFEPIEVLRLRGCLAMRNIHSAQDDRGNLDV
jgi:hypothetical protein